MSPSSAPSDTAEPNNPPPANPDDEPRALLFGKLVAALGSLLAFALFAAYDITHPAMSVPMWYMVIFASVFLGVFSIDIIQRKSGGG